MGYDMKTLVYMFFCLKILPSQIHEVERERKMKKKE